MFNDIYNHDWNKFIALPFLKRYDHVHDYLREEHKSLVAVQHTGHIFGKRAQCDQVHLARSKVSF